MLLTNSKQIIMLKMEQNSFFELVISENQTAENDNHESSKQIYNDFASFDALQRKLRQMEDSIFEESTQIFKLLNEDAKLSVDGLPYSEIQQSLELCNALHLIRENSPIYQHLNKRKKTTLMKRIATKYMQEIKKNDRSCLENQAGIERNQSQNQCEEANQRSLADTNTITPIKKKIINKALKDQKNYHSNNKKIKKVHFSKLSSCKHFCSRQPPKRILRKQISLIKTY